MADRREFIAEDAWLVVGVMTLPTIILAGLAGFPSLSGAIAVLGWLLLTPLLLFWGEEIAAFVFGESEPEAESTVSPVDELKVRYARGEIDEAEFERRVDVLLAVDDRTSRTLERE